MVMSCPVAGHYGNISEPCPTSYTGDMKCITLQKVKAQHVKCRPMYMLVLVM
jgi:hypothetical protein